MDQSVWGPGEYVAVLSIALGGMYLLSRLAAWLGWVSTDTEEPSEEQPAVMSSPDADMTATLLFLFYCHARKVEQAARTTEPNYRTELPNQAGGYRKLTESQQTFAEKALRAGLSMSDLCVAFGGTKALRLEELRPIKARVDAEFLAKEIANPLIEVGDMEPLPH